MRMNRFIPTIAVGLLLPFAAWAQGPPLNQLPATTPALGDPAKKVEEPPTDAEKTIDKAIAKVKVLKSVSADVTQKVDMLKEKFEVTGLYLRAPGDRIYLKLAVSTPTDSAATMLQVCDGKVLWDYNQVLDSQSFRKLDILQIRKKLTDPILDDAARERVLAQIGFTGPEEMLVGLRSSVKFNQKADAEFEGHKVWVIRGQWKSVLGLTGPGQQPLSPTTPLPPYIPSNIAVTIDQETGWPYKVEMLGNTPSLLQEDVRRIGLDGRPVGAKSAVPKVEPSRIVLMYSNVKLNPDLKPETFAFDAPRDAKNLVDGTDALLNYLDQIIQLETGRKRAEAAKADPLLGGSLEIPKTAPPIEPPPAPPK